MPEESAAGGSPSPPPLLWSPTANGLECARRSKPAPLPSPRCKEVFYCCIAIGRAGAVTLARACKEAAAVAVAPKRYAHEGDAKFMFDAIAFDRPSSPLTCLSGSKATRTTRATRAALSRWPISLGSLAKTAAGSNQQCCQGSVLAQGCCTRATRTHRLCARRHARPLSSSARPPSWRRSRRASRRWSARGSRRPLLVAPDLSLRRKRLRLAG